MNDIREAAERLRAMQDKPLFTIQDQDGDARTVGKNGVAIPWVVFNAMRTVANAYLAEHDPTPVDAEWLLANGFIQSELYGGDRGIWILTALDRDGDDFDVCWNADKSYAELWVGSRVMIIPATTRGQVQRLLNVLRGE